MIFLLSFLALSCNRDNEEEPKPEPRDERLYDPTKAFKTLFVFHVGDQNPYAFNYWFDVTRIKSKYETKSSSDELDGRLPRMPNIKDRVNNKFLVTYDNYLNYKFVITIFVTEIARCDTCKGSLRTYRSDTLTFRNINDTLRIIRYPQDTITFIKRVPGNPR